MSSVLHIGLLTPLVTGDPRLTSDYANVPVRNNVFESPLRAGEGGQLEAALIEWPLRQEPGSDARPVRSAAVLPGRFFSDGTPVTADALLRSLLRTPALTRRADVGVHDGRLVFQLKRPDTRFDYLLATSAVPVVADGLRGPIGTGPFVLEPGPPARLLRNPHYRPAPSIDEVAVDVHAPGADGFPRALVEAVNAGRVDFTHQVPYAALAQVHNVRKIARLGYCTCSLFFNTERAPFDSAAVRRAFARAVDRQALAAICYSNPLAFTARNLLPPTMGRHDDGVAFDLAAARELLAQSGVRPPAQPLELVAIPLPRPYLPDPEGVAARLARDLGALGWPLRVVLPRDLKEYATLVGRGAYDLALQGWQPDSPDALEYIETHVGSTHVPVTPDGIALNVNVARYRNAAMDAVLQEHRERGDDESWRRLQRLLAEDMPLLPLIYGPYVAVVSWRVTRLPSSFLFGPFLHELALS
jgi:peptide/nickel transport system substrate-binding protein